FYFAASIINTCYFAQIVVAAALTALGASGASDVAVTVFGATNTIIAGILTYLKGQGLPNRLRMYRNGLRKCREFIEEKERECEAEGWFWEDGDGEGGFDVDEVVDVVVRMYHDVRQTAEDTYLPTQGGNSSSAAAAPLLAREKNLGGNSIHYPDDDDYRSESEPEGEPEGENAKPPSQPAPAPATSGATEEAPATGKHVSPPSLSS
ncbi:MAG: hypothetical protein Q9173_007349, partial [Seirophora scorigena]